MTDPALDMGQDVRQIRFRFLDAVEPHRPALFRYCRSLTRTVWDAEDLSQDTLLKAFARLGQVHHELHSPRSYLFRIATRTWIDRLRKRTPDALPEAYDPADAEEATEGLDVREALEALARRLPPQERVAVLLKDVFGFSLAETAAALTTSVGAVKAALHRGRKKLREQRDDESPPPAPTQLAPELLDRFVERFNAHDLQGLAALFREDAEAEVVGMVHEIGRERIKSGSLEHTLFDPQGTPRASLAEHAGERLVLLWYADAEGAERVGDVLRFVTDPDGIRQLHYYYYCPELLAEVTSALGHPLTTNGYRYTPKG